MSRANVLEVATVILVATLTTLASVGTVDAEAVLPSGFEESVVVDGFH